MVPGQFSPIILIGMSRHGLLNEVDNKQIEEDVLKERNNKINFNTASSSIEDHLLPKTPAVTDLLQKVEEVVKSVNKY